MSWLSRLFGPARGLGCVEDQPDDRDLGFERLGVGSSPPSESSMALFCTVLDQGGTQSCVAHAVAQGLLVAHRAVGRAAYKLPSRRFLYWGARGYDGEELIDLGTRIRSAMKFQVALGSPDESFCPWDPKLINRAPSWSAYRHAFDQRGLKGYYRIVTSGEERLDEIRRAVASDRPVAFGTGVSRDFVNGVRSGSAHDPPMSVIGRHAMLVVGYEPGRFRIVNSWGRLWDDGGFGWLSEDYLAHPGTKDLWALDVEAGAS